MVSFLAKKKRKREPVYLTGQVEQGRARKEEDAEGGFDVMYDDDVPAARSSRLLLLSSDGRRDEENKQVLPKSVENFRYSRTFIAFLSVTSAAKHQPLPKLFSLRFSKMLSRSDHRK